MITVTDIMNTNPVSIIESATYIEAATLMAETMSSDLNVLDDNGLFIGTLSEGDMIRYIIPDFNDLASPETVTMEQANKHFLEAGSFAADIRISPIILHTPVILNPDDTLLKAAVIMTEKQIRSLPVIKNKRVLGLVTRASLCLGLATSQLKSM